MISEVLVERFRFACHGCGHVWFTDYDLQHVEDEHGVVWEYYSLDGMPVTAPTARGSVNCPRCSAGWASVDLVAVREVPLVRSPEEDPGRPRQPADAGRRAERDQAPRLSGETAPSPAER